MSATSTSSTTGPAVRNGSYYPKVTKEKFLQWAARDVTDALPEGRYQEWGGSRWFNPRKISAFAEEDL